MENKINYIEIDNIKSRILKCDDKMQDVEINKMENLEDEKMIVVWFDAIYEDETMPLVFIVPTNEDYVITPWDWQGYMPENLDEIEEIDWRINTSGRRAIMFCGLPRIF